MNILTLTSFVHVFCGDYAAATAQIDELVTLADEKGAVYWRAFGMWMQGWLCALSSKAADAVHMLTSGMTAWRSTGATLYAPTQLSCLAAAYAKLGQFDDAQRNVSEAMSTIETTKERWFEAEVYRTAGNIALMSSVPDKAKAQTYFERALAVAREQQAKSYELRAAMCLARLRRSQGKQQQARDLLAPVYGWFTEGFDTLDLKEAKALLDALSS
jgi:predicted ATPase